MRRRTDLEKAVNDNLRNSLRANGHDERTIDELMRATSSLVAEVGTIKVPRSRPAELSNQTKLAVAAALNGTMFVDWQLTKENLRTMLLGTVGDYFVYNPVESSQFSKDVVMAELKAIPDDEAGHSKLLNLLGQIGFRCRPNPKSRI